MTARIFDSIFCTAAAQTQQLTNCLYWCSNLGKLLSLSHFGKIKINPDTDFVYLLCIRFFFHVCYLVLLCLVQTVFSTFISLNNTLRKFIRLYSLSLIYDFVQKSYEYVVLNLWIFKLLVHLSFVYKNYWVVGESKYERIFHKRKQKTHIKEWLCV